MDFAIVLAIFQGPSTSARTRWHGGRMTSWNGCRKGLAPQGTAAGRRAKNPAHERCRQRSWADSQFHIGRSLAAWLLEAPSPVPSWAFATYGHDREGLWPRLVAQVKSEELYRSRCLLVVMPGTANMAGGNQHTVEPPVPTSIEDMSRLWNLMTATHCHGRTGAHYSYNSNSPGAT